MLRLLMTAIVGTLLMVTGSHVAYAQAAYAAGNVVECRDNEQKGCLQLSLLSLQAPRDFNRAAGMPHGPTYYERFLNGELFAAAPRTFTIYLYGINTVPSQTMKEYRFDPGYKNMVRQNRAQRLTTKMSPLPVTQVSTAGAPIFDPKWAHLGQAQVAYRVSLPYGGGAFQFPKAMLTSQTYILICADNAQDQGVFPNRLHGAQDGIWLTPSDLNNAKDYLVVWPFLFKS